MTLIILGLAWIAGLLAGLHLDLPLPTLALFLSATAALALLLRRKGRSWPVALAGLVILLGLLRVELSPSPANTIPLGSDVALKGLVVSSSELAGASERFVFQPHAIARNIAPNITPETAQSAGQSPAGHAQEDARWEAVSGKVLVIAKPPASLAQARERPYFRYGDELIVRGRPESPLPFDDFDYPAYLERQGIRHTLPFPEVEFLAKGKGNPLKARLHQVRLGAASRLDAILPQTQAALAQALLLGKRDALPQEVREDFRASGTSHLLAVSGLHVGVVLFLTISASRLALGRRRQIYLLIPLAMVWSYAALTGLVSPVERAAIMATVYLCALAIGRPRSHLPAILLAAAVMAGWDPGALLDVSFQLSFAAVAGLAVILPMIDSQRSPASDDGIASGVLQHVKAVLWVSIVATAATLPLVAFNFHQVPTLGIPTTILALPAIPLVLGSSALALAADLVYSPLGRAVGWYAWIPLTYTLELVGLVARVPGATFAVPAVPNALVLAYYAGLVLLALLPQRLRSVRRWLEMLRTWTARDRAGAPDSSNPMGRAPRLALPGLVLPGLVVVAVVVVVVLWARVLGGGDGRLHVTFLDVGQGDAILIESPGGKRLLVDGGPTARAALRHLDDRSSFWGRNIDLMVLTHGDEDHFAGLVEVARRYSVGMVLQGSPSSESPLYPGWEQVLADKELTPVAALRGQRIDLGEPVLLEVLHPPEGYGEKRLSSRNNSGAVLRLSYGRISFLLTADIEAEAERDLLRRYATLDSTVLKVAHHGSNTSSAPAFLRSVSPRIAVVSAGEGNPFGHPSPLTMSRLREALPSDRIYSTAERGSIRFSTDGHRLWLHTDR